MHLHSRKSDSVPKRSPATTKSVNRNLAVLSKKTADSRKHTPKWRHPAHTNKRGYYNMEAKFYGIDVSKDTLDIASDGKVERIGNNLKDIKAFIKGIPASSYIAMEATNTYHLMMADQCYAKGMQVYVINPRVTRHYREVRSLRGHNDRMDAMTIAGFIKNEHEHQRPYAPKPEDQRKLQTLTRRRAVLVAEKVVFSQSLSEIKEIKGSVKRIIKELDAAIAEIVRLIEKMLEGNEDRERLLTIKGVGDVVSAGVLPDLESGDFKSADAFVAFYGLDPKPNDSGKSKGRRKISKQGQRTGRTLLYNAAMSASRSKAWRGIYQSYLDRGLAKVQAIVALARRIARTIWSVYTHKTTFDPARITKAA